MKIEGNTFIVTGGARGLGEGAIRCFVEKGGNGVIFDVDEKSALVLVKDLGEEKVFWPGKVDVSSEESVVRAINKTVERFGRIAGVVNCAGIIRAGLTAAKDEDYGVWGPQTLEDFKLMCNVNLVGCYNVTRQVSLKMIHQEPFEEDDERGVFINISSLASTDGQFGAVGYAATKGGISAMVLPMTRDLSRYGIRVNGIAPGVFYTPMAATMLSKDAKPHEYPARLGTIFEFGHLCNAIVENRMINGTVIRLDAGMRNPRPELINPSQGDAPAAT